MSSGKEISFTLEGLPKVPPPAVPVPLPAGAPEPPAPAVFGPEFGGAFTFRWPGALDLPRIDAAVVAFYEDLGVKNQGDVDELRYRTVFTHELVKRLGIKTPDWFSPDAPDTHDLQLATLRVWGLFWEQFGLEKKASTPAAGGSPA